MTAPGGGGAGRRTRLVAAACVLAGALLAGCSSTSAGVAGPPGPAPADTTTGSTAPVTASSSSGGATDGTRSLGVSTPVPPDPGTGAAGAATPGATATPARTARTGDTQRHPFAPTSVTLTTRGSAPATAPVEVTDTTSSGELGLPRDPGQVGWWQSGALAGDLFGSVVLAGHLDSRDQGIGFFARLLRVTVGDEVVLADGAYQQRYRVTATRDVPKADLATGTDTFSQTVPGRLVLLTCTGPWDPVTHYPDNLVVTADPVGDPVAR